MWRSYLSVINREGMLGYYRAISLHLTSWGCNARASKRKYNAVIDCYDRKCVEWAGIARGRPEGGPPRHSVRHRQRAATVVSRSPPNRNISSVVQMLLFLWRSCYCKCWFWVWSRQRPMVSAYCVYVPHVPGHPGSMCLRRAAHARGLFASAAGQTPA